MFPGSQKTALKIETYVMLSNVDKRKDAIYL